MQNKKTEKKKYYFLGFISAIALMLLVVGFVMAYKFKTKLDLEEQLIQEDFDKVEKYTAKFSHVDETNTSIYLPEYPFNHVNCNFGNWGCSSSYIDSNGNTLFDDDFENIGSTQYVYCNCRTD